MSPPFLSVITPTHDRRDSLLRLLAALRDGTFPPERFEVIVVADGCTDDTVATLRAAAYPFALTVLEQSPGRGAAAARNLGTSRAVGDVLVFIDDDIEPLPTLLATHARLHAAQDDLVMIGAPIPVRGPRMSLDQIAAWGWWEQQFERMSRDGHRFTYDEVFSGILSVRASRFAEAGRFQVQFDNCRDDSELGVRLLRAGGRVAFAREAGGIHHELRNHARLVVRKRAEGRADVLLAEGHPELWPVLRLAWPLTAPWTPLGALRRLAFAAPRAGDAAAALLSWSLVLFERIRARGWWRMAEAGLMYFNYWRGVAAHVGGRARFDAFAAGSARRATEIARHARANAPEIDLADGIEAAERAIDALRPVSLLVRGGGAVIGRVPYVPGAEPLRGEHLRRILATDLERPLSIALALREARADAGTEVGA